VIRIHEKKWLNPKIHIEMNQEREREEERRRNARHVGYLKHNARKVGQHGCGYNAIG
jgi:hypothetical protein